MQAQATKERNAKVLTPYFAENTGPQEKGWWCPVLFMGVEIHVGPCPNRGAAIVEATKRAKAEEAREQ